MKTSEFNKKIGLLFVAVALVSPVFSQKQLITFTTSINYQFTASIICVLGLAAFLLTAFMKQKK